MHFLVLFICVYLELKLVALVTFYSAGNYIWHQFGDKNYTDCRPT